LWGDCDDWLKRAWEASRTAQERSEAALIIGWYRRSPWTDKQLTEIIRAAGVAATKERNKLKMLAGMGVEGAKLLKEWNMERMGKESASR
jgi:hypothetical protein